MISQSMLEHVNAALKNNIRLDGRKLDECRDFKIEVGVTKSAEGSARVRWGNNDVFVGVKLAVGTPFPDSPDKGVLMVGCELRPIAHKQFEAGPPSIESIETARVIDRGIRESHTIDEKSLCITPGEKVWIVNIDICPVNYDGNLIDVGTIGALAALKNATFPTLKDDGTVDYGAPSKQSLPVNEAPIAITIGKIGKHLILDPTAEEEAILDARLTTTSIGNGKICAMQKGGDASLTIDEVSKMVNLSSALAKKFRAKVK